MAELITNLAKPHTAQLAPDVKIATSHLERNAGRVKHVILLLFARVIIRAVGRNRVRRRLLVCGLWVLCRGGLVRHRG